MYRGLEKDLVIPIDQMSFSTLREQARALGLWAPFLPSSLGGRNLPLDAYARLSEVLGWTPFGHYV
jgi:alkylation response protein AidB-like acyl-CoA dehydrogenase